jgi:hypothetical protein
MLVFSSYQKKTRFQKEKEAREAKKSQEMTEV